MATTISERAVDWCRFQCRVFAHIENYTVPQYGDKSDDQASEFTSQDCVTNIKRYANRFGKNSRGEKEQLLDLIKIAHYAQLAYDKLDEELKDETT